MLDSSPLLGALLVKCLSLLLSALDLALDLLLGWTVKGGTRGERRRAEEEYEKSAQIVSVLAKQALVPVWPIPDEVYSVYKHERYVSPRLALESDRYSLAYVTREEAVFGIYDDNDDDGEGLYDTQRHPFHPVAVYERCARYLVVPVKSFHRLAEECGDPGHPVTVVTCSMRSGSTLLAQAMNRLPGTRSVSEPFALDAVCYMWQRNKLGDKETRHLLRSTLRLLTKVSPARSPSVERVVIKASSYNNALLGAMKELFPSFSFACSVRRPIPSVRSLHKMVGQHNRCAGWAYAALGLFWRSHPVAALHSKRELDAWIQLLDDGEACSLWYALNLERLTSNKGVFCQAVYYEDLIENPRATLSSFFSAIGASPSLVPSALAALERDSQEGVIKNSQPFQGTDRLKEWIDKYMEKAGLPLRADCSLQEFKELVGVPHCHT